ncbi:hypothetical protein NDU88_004764 [Pleurodeles waltl]|uniref:Uncharacterized protein n=1 Tax=Pleurodeles waltl TaxID=8319 RepID=A0AAV7PG44_PLEWA|nr:hypothetical protein NDU88_004764 [Pleurodeles waltl]
MSVLTAQRKLEYLSQTVSMSDVVIAVALPAEKAAAASRFRASHSSTGSLPVLRAPQLSVARVKDCAQCGGVLIAVTTPYTRPPALEATLGFRAPGYLPLLGKPSKALDVRALRLLRLDLLRSVTNCNLCHRRPPEACAPCDLQGLARSVST